MAECRDEKVWAVGRGGGGHSGGVAKGKYCYLLSGTVQLKLQLHPFLGSPTPGISAIHPQQGIFSPVQNQVVGGHMCNTVKTKSKKLYHDDVWRKHVFPVQRMSCVYMHLFELNDGKQDWRPQEVYS